MTEGAGLFGRSCKNMCKNSSLLLLLAVCSPGCPRQDYQGGCTTLQGNPAPCDCRQRSPAAQPAGGQPHVLLDTPHTLHIR